jgi:putative ABC transport system permease protein
MNDQATGAVLIYLKDMKKIETDMGLLRKALEGAGYTLMDRDGKAFWMKLQEVSREEWTGQKLDLSTWEDEISYISWTRGVIDAISVLLSGVLLVIIAIGIMNSMWIAIRERTREIGTLRAIGMQRGKVMQMFVFEALLLGLFGTSSGAALGSLVAVFFNALHLPIPEGAQFFLMSSTMKFGFDPMRIFLSAGVITLCTTLISLIPSFKAARLKPVTAMSHI